MRPQDKLSYGRIGEPLDRVPHAPNSPQFCGLFGAPFLILGKAKRVSPAAADEQGLCPLHPAAFCKRRAQTLIYTRVVRERQRRLGRKIRYASAGGCYTTAKSMRPQLTSAPTQRTRTLPPTRYTRPERWSVNWNIPSYSYCPSGSASTRTRPSTVLSSST